MEPFLRSRFSTSSTALEEDVQEEDVLEDVLRVQVATFALRAHRSVRASSLNPHQAWLKDRCVVKALKSVGGCSGSFQSHIPGCPPFSGDDNGGQQHQRDTGRVHLSVPWRTDLDPRQSQRASVKWQASLGIIHQRESADVRSGYSSLPGSSG